MMAQAVPHQMIDRKRVKVYELRNNDWFDRGTGFCSSTYITTDDGEVREPRIIVESEDEPERLLLDTRIHHEDGFQRQQGMLHPSPYTLAEDTLIVWTEPTTGLDMALSFQEAEGCLLIWNFINDIQRTIAAPIGEDTMSDEVPVDIPATITLPPAELGNLQDIETNMRIMSTTAGGRDALSRCIISDDYIRKLIPLVDVAEDLESLADLHHLCNIVKIILLMNDTAIIEYALSDDCLLGVVGALEYDPDFPSHKANHRDWLSNQGRYKEVVHIEEEVVRRKIHQTYRLQYLKDVVLARILDDPTFSVLNSLIFFNQVDIVQHLQSNGNFLGDLFGIFTDPNEALLRKKQAVIFIQQCCAIVKNLQPPARMTLYNNFLSHGLLHVINFGLRNPDVSVRIGATDILVSMIDHDPQMIRQTIYRQMHEQQVQLTDTLIDLLHVEVDLGIKSQICDALKVLLDPVPLQVATVESSVNGNGKEVQLGTRRLHVDPQQELFLSHFYEHSAVRLFKPLLDLENQQELHFNVLSESIFNYLNDIISFFIRTHHHRCKFFLMQHNLAFRFVQLLHCGVKHLQLVAVRFFRQLISMRDEFYMRHIMEKRLIEPIFDLLDRCLPRDNLLCSACLEFFDFFTKEDLGELTKHLVSTYNDRIQSLSHLPTFRDLLTGRYPQPGQQNPHQQAVLGSNNHVAGQQLVSPTDDGSVSVARAPNGGHTSLLDSIAMDPEEEAYWNGEDEDEELHNPLGSPDEDQTNGESSVLKQLVDYPSDEEGDEGEGSDPAEHGAVKPADEAQADDVSGDSAVMSDEEDEDAAGANGNSDAENASPPASQNLPPASAHLSGTPPERVSEKRRREEDEEDDLAKMMLQNKRRNSRSSTLNSGISILQKMSTGVNRNGAEPSANATAPTTMSTSGSSTPAKKISINITSPSLQVVATEATGPGQGDDMA